MKGIIKFKLPQIVLFFLALILNFEVFSQTTVAVNKTIQCKKVYPTSDATTGTPTNINGYNIHTFNANGTFSIPVGFTATNVNVLIVAGGGGGGCRHAGGGGAGGLINKTAYSLSNTSTSVIAKPVVIGNGGAGALTISTYNGVKGAISSFDGYAATGGGGGGSNGHAGQSGGSGGGGSNGSYGGSGTAAQGKSGGNQNNGAGCCYPFGAGGGGSSAAGANTSQNLGSNGGAGTYLVITGTSVSYADGGGGGNSISSSYTGGNGNGGSGGNGNTNANPGLSGTANTGSGGGGGGATSGTDGPGGVGGSGVVIIKYLSNGTGTWTSDDNTIATVDNNGLVKGIAVGTTNINYKEVDGTLSNSSYVQQIKVTTALPVTLLYFNVYQKDCTAQITWETASEINSNYYVVEKSIDGIIFYESKKFASKNLSTGAAYACSFAELVNGNTFYRLKMIDIDGQYTYSKTVVATSNENCGNGLQLKISPNPAKSFILVEGVSKGNLLSLVNAEGKIVTTIKAQGITQNINISTFPKGVYYLRCEALDGSTQSLKIVKQ